MSTEWITVEHEGYKAEADVNTPLMVRVTSPSGKLVMTRMSIIGAAKGEGELYGHRGTDRVEDANPDFPDEVIAALSKKYDKALHAHWASMEKR